MELVKLSLYIFITLFLASIVIFNLLYSAQLKKVESILSIELSPILKKVQKADMVVPTIFLFLALLVTIIALLT